jgi:hypothetical protein
VVSRGRVEHPKTSCNEIGRLASAAPRSEAREEGTFLKGFDISLQVPACQNAGIAGIELVGYWGATTLQHIRYCFMSLEFKYTP